MKDKSDFPKELSPAVLRNRCDPVTLDFSSTDDLPDLEDVIGQPRAIRALELGSGVSGPGFNTFVLGRPGSGRTTLSREYLERKASHEAMPSDWCYVNNFEDARFPKALQMPAGEGIEFRKAIQELVTRCKAGVSRAFASDEYKQEHDRILSTLKQNQETEFNRLKEYAEKDNFVIARSAFGFMLVPVIDGEPLTPEQVAKLSSEEQTKLEQLQKKIGDELEKTLTHLRTLEKQTNEQIERLNEATILFLLEPMMRPLFDKYENLKPVITHLIEVQADIISNADKFRGEEPGEGALPVFPLAQRDWARRYEVNLLVDNSLLNGAPVVVENHPSYGNLLGRIEHEVAMGASRTDFSMIHPGALHRANGGYLVIPARDLLINPYAWEGLKRVLREGEIRIVELANQVGLVNTITLEPEPIPLQIKIVLVGTPLLYYMLQSLDEDFAKLFQVRAEFTTSMQRTPETEHEYGLFVKSVVLENKLPPFDNSAVAKIIEYSSRLAEDQHKLSTRFGKIADLIREATFWANREARNNQKHARKSQPVQLVTADDVNKAIDESLYRSNLIEERIQELIADGTLMIDVRGEKIGQINALSVIQLGDFGFGKPSRVTASVYAGRNGIVDIERQANLGGPLHTKGVLILNGFLGQRFGQQKALSISANLTFEQSYEGVEGDSASTAELLSLLSAIGNIPLRQDLAITGSINQHGQMQAIGGVNEKIEGFFTTCKAMGLTGEQGVVIPRANSHQLMLNDQVVEAVEQGHFHIWTVTTIDEVILLFTGMEAGDLQEDGSFPQGSFNHAVANRLQDFAKIGEKEDKGKNEADEQVKGDDLTQDDEKDGDGENGSDEPAEDKERVDTRSKTK